MEYKNKIVIKFSIIRLIIMIVGIAIVLIGGISGVTYSRYVLNKNFSGTGASAPFYFDAVVTANQSDYTKGEDTNIPIEITIKNNDGTNYNKYETKYEITCENSKFTMTGTATGTIGNTKTDKNISLQLKPNNEGQLSTGATETITFKIKSTEPYAKEITKQVTITIKEDKYKDLKIGDPINPEDYGRKVNEYNVETDTVGCWRLFYKDANYTYLISDNKINLGDTLDNLYRAAGYGSKTGRDVSGIGKRLNPMMMEAGGFTSKKKDEGIRGVAYLTNPEQWEKYKGTDAIFAIGGPTIELFIKSFNAAGEAANDNRPNLSVKASSTGYEQDYLTVDDDFKIEYNHGIYRKDTNGLWYISSQHQDVYSDSVFGIYDLEGRFNPNTDTHDIASSWRNIRPIVCIPTATFDSKYTLEEEIVDDIDVTIGEAINAKKYGWKVEGYTSTDEAAQTEAGCWRLFYQDEENTYLIADNKIALKSSLQSLYTTAGWDKKTGEKVSKIGQGLNPMLKNAGGLTSSNTNSNIKAVGYLTDPKEWKKYKGTDAIFAIGGPSIELFVESFNAAGKAAQDSRPELSVSATNAGYKEVYSTKSNDFKTGYNHGIYRKETSGYWWLSSPSGNYSDTVWGVYETDGYFNANNVSHSYAVRPLVCIQTSVFREKYETNLKNE